MRRALFSLSPLISLLLLLLYTMSSRKISIIDHEIAEYTHNIYTVTCHDYSIQTMVTHSHSIATEWLTSCSSELRDVGSSRSSGLHIIGLGIECFPNLHDQDNPVALLQIAVGTRCLIFQFQHEPGIPQSLIDFLGNCSYVFVGVGIQDDVQKLVKHYGLNVTNVKDLYDWAGKGVIGLKGLAREILSWEIEKPKRITLSQWNKLWLTSAQVLYACLDAFVSLKIGEALDAAEK